MDAQKMETKQYKHRDYAGDKKKNRDKTAIVGPWPKKKLMEKKKK